VIFVVLAIAVSTIYASNFAEGSSYNPLPAVKVDSMPSINDFVSKDKSELLAGYEHTVLVKENGEKIEIYFLYTKGLNTKPVAIFYFEDETDDDLENYQPFNSDFFYLFFKTKISGEDEKFVYAERGTKSGSTKEGCIDALENFDAFWEGKYSGCTGGSVVVKKIEGGWAAYMKSFNDLPPPTNENPYFFQLNYGDIEKVEDNVPELKYFFWPKYEFYTTIIPVSNVSPQEFLVNNGKVTHTEFLYKPWDLLTKGLVPNVFSCADDSIFLDSDQKNYSKDDVARFTAKINSDVFPTEIFLKIYDYAQNVVVSKTANYKGNDIIFQVDLKDFDQGLYTVVGKFGIDGAKSEVKFMIGDRPFSEEVDEKCYFYALYDKNSRELSLLFNVNDGSYSNFDEIQVFVDANGNGGKKLQSDDVTIIIDKNRFGGLKYKSDYGWLISEKNEIQGDSRIKLLSKEYQALVKIPNVSNDVRISFGQIDYNNFELKTSQLSSASFSTIPDSWSKPTFTNISIEKMKSDKWIPDEIILNQQIDVNLILIGDEWDGSFKNKIQSKLEKKYLPIVLSENNRAGIQYDYSYNFISASEQQSNDLFNLMKTENEHLRPFYGGGEYDDPWGIAVWIRNNHTEWANEIQTRYEVDYKLIDAEMVEDFIYENIISKDNKLSKSSSVNFVFISGDMDDVDFLHNYKLKRTDGASDQPHKAIGLMGYGGNYNFYYFDLYAYPWEDFQGFDFFYDTEMNHHFKNFHDIDDEDEKAELIFNYVNNATALIATPSYVYPPVYKDKFILDLVIVGKSGTAAVSTLLDHYINQEKIESELEAIVPYSDWEIRVTLEDIRSRNLPNDLKKELEFYNNIPLYDYPGAPVIDVIDSEQLSKQLATWALTRTSGDFKDYTKIKDSTWTISALVVVGERDNPVHILVEGFLASGIAPSNPDYPTIPCCVLGVTYDKAVWEDEVSVTDLVLHEVGHAIGLMHPFQGVDVKGKIFYNPYFNWYLSPMTYGSPPDGCGFWYGLYVEGSCGISDAKFTKFEKDNHARGVTSYLVRAALIDVYRTMVDLEEKGKDPNNPSPNIQNSLDIINTELGKTRNAFLKNDILSDNGALNQWRDQLHEEQDQ